MHENHTSMVCWEIFVQIAPVGTLSVLVQLQYFTKKWNHEIRKVAVINKPGSSSIFESYGVPTYHGSGMQQPHDPRGHWTKSSTCGSSMLILHVIRSSICKYMMIKAMRLTWWYTVFEGELCWILEFTGLSYDTFRGKSWQPYVNLGHLPPIH